jgi:hypothetical protein
VVGIEVNIDRIKYVVMYHHQNEVKNNNLMITNKSFENVTKFKYFGIT